MKMEVQLRIFTLNCWGIPGVSSDRKARIHAIANELSRGCYDLVALQEVWSYSDYEIIARKVYPSMRYSYYFRSGCLGSGLCIFSKGQIIDTVFQTWPLNGYAHRIHHGDWFGGKGVGLARIFYQGLVINFYTAHLHAVYNHNNDDYLSHRVCQAFEFSQFVSATSSNCDVVIAAGDFNAETADVPYRLICYNANLLDAFEQCEKKDGGNGATNETSRNTYTPHSVIKANPLGRRIDYILFNYHNGTEVKVVSCTLPLDKVPDQNFSFSDHEAISATLDVVKSVSAKKLEGNRYERINALQATKRIIESDFSRLQYDRLIYLIVFGLIFCFVFGTVHLQIPYGLQALLGIMRIILSVAMMFCLIMATIWNRSEVNALSASNSSVQILLDFLHAENEMIHSAGDATRIASERV